MVSGLDVLMGVTGAAANVTSLAFTLLTWYAAYQSNKEACADLANDTDIIHGQMKDLAQEPHRIVMIERELQSLGATLSRAEILLNELLGSKRRKIAKILWAPSDNARIRDVHQAVMNSYALLHGRLLSLSVILKAPRDGGKLSRFLRKMANLLDRHAPERTDHVKGKGIMQM